MATKPVETKEAPVPPVKAPAPPPPPAKPFYPLGEGSEPTI